MSAPFPAFSGTGLKWETQMPAWFLLPAVFLCISLFTLFFNQSHSHNRGNLSLIYSSRCCNCRVMPPNEPHLPASHDNGETAHCYRFYYCSRVYNRPADVGLSEGGQCLGLLDPNLSELFQPGYLFIFSNLLRFCFQMA